MICKLHLMILLQALLITFVACNAPPVPLDDIVIEKTSIPEECVRAVQSGDFVRYHYHGTFPDGKKFDSSYDKGSTYNVYVGKRQLIEGMDKALIGMCVNERRLVKIPPKMAYGKDGYASLLFVFYSHTRMRTYDTYVGIGWLIAGMDQGVLGMCVGEKRIITMPPSLGYGENGDGSDIPGQASLVFDVVLLDLHNTKDGITVEKLDVPETCQRKSKVGDFIRYHYNGTLMDGTLFDSSYSRKRTYDTYIGKGYVIAGMDEGLLGVCVGEKRRVTIPPHLAYGEEGTGTEIPGSAVLIFDIDVIDFHNPSDTVEITTFFKPSKCDVLSKKGDFVKYHYNATLMDGIKKEREIRIIYVNDHFRHNYGKTYNIVLGSGQVVLGMDIGLKDMCIGEKRTVVIPPHLGYGERGVEGEVPGSAVLVFDIEMIDLEEGLPDGYMFIWNSDTTPDLFSEMDKNLDGHVDPVEPAMQPPQSYSVCSSGQLTGKPAGTRPVCRGCWCAFLNYINHQVATGKGKLAPGFDVGKIIDNMFSNQDRNSDGKITADEFKLKDEETKDHDEL
ncbi:UNVERIFIED_CONTAM: hypothetical protein FKN15_009240 [Acipenser sinensis]